MTKLIDAFSDCANARKIGLSHQCACDISIKYYECACIIALVFCAMFYCQLWLVWLYYVFPRHFINNMVFEGKILNIKCVFRFSLHLFSEVFLSVRRILRHIVINFH